jgi:hypothetical protein
VFFEASLGNWLLNIYSELTIGNEVGEIYHVIVVIVNMVLMLNLVIAILSETYARLSPQRLGLYYDSLIATLPALAYDKKYGSLILLPPPFSVLTIFLMPYFAWKDPKDRSLKDCNKTLTKIFFLPLAMLFTIIFMTYNLLMIPLAYVRALSYKINQLCCCCFRRKSGHGVSIVKTTGFMDLITFLFFGVFMLLAS